MKFLLLFISLTYMSWGPITTPVDTKVQDQLNTVEAASFEIFPVDITEVARAQYGDLNETEMQAAIQELLVNDYVTGFNLLEVMDNECLDDCQQYGVNCSCGTTLYFQWCPCPGFESSPEAQGALFCNQACNEQ